MNAHVHPIFADILRSFELQPTMLHRAAVKAEARRFTGELMTGFGDIGDPTSERAREVRDQEGADHDREDHRERIARGD